MSIRKYFGMVASFFGLMAANAQATTMQTANNNTSKEITQMQRPSNRPEAVKDRFGGFGEVKQKIGWTPVNHNQRQYRKWMRQVPQMRRSKKCRLN